jgi:hypothetical protein
LSPAKLAQQAKKGRRFAPRNDGRAAKSLRGKTKFLSNFKLIWFVQIKNEKYFALSELNPALEPA